MIKLRSWQAWEARASATELTFTFFVFLILVASCLWPTLRLPFYGDEGAFYVPWVRQIFELGWRPSQDFQLQEIHPPLWMALLAGCTWLFGWKISVIRFACFCASAGFLTWAYALMRLRARILLSALGAVALFFSPIVYSQSSMAQVDLPMAGFALASIYFLLVRRPMLSSVFFALGLATNATLLVLTPAIYFLWQSIRTELSRSEKLKGFFYFVGPGLFTLVLWLAYFAGTQKSWFYLSEHGRNIDNYWHLGISAIWQVFSKMRPAQMYLWDGRWILTASLVIGGFWLRLKKRMNSRLDAAVCGFLLILLSEWIFLSFFGNKHQRYFLVSLPYLNILAVWMLELCLPFLGCLVLLLNASWGHWSWQGEIGTYGIDEYRLTSRNVTFLIQSAAARLESQTHKTWIWTHWPVTDAFRHSYLGYVSRDYEKVLSWNDIAPAEVDQAIKAASVAGDAAAIIELDFIDGPHSSSFQRLVDQGFSQNCVEEKRDIWRMTICFWSGSAAHESKLEEPHGP